MLMDSSDGFILINKYFDLCLQLLNIMSGAVLACVLLPYIYYLINLVFCKPSRDLVVRAFASDLGMTPLLRQTKRLKTVAVRSFPACLGTVWRTSWKVCLMLIVSLGKHLTGCLYL